ncbi:hypothetical protein BI364_05230 [Acidihalobacter yilgarnensis]|uniref:DUF4337 domain-containing protein n=1 Tax=Acidihalobacter yilgarnensis TaxID=2819280 RepID=A0A1D8ILY4_9GAMM|nr:DUF4337 domain-containing protein [Acidihalobacter yilgarnensis]AOU97457.1 hypothetical protein BI364_05230 [Acidihalobacter yilgarnensis]
MPNDGFHVHGPHEHELEHRAQHEGPGLSQYVAIFTAVLATLGAVVSYHVSATQNEAMMLKNEAVLESTKASDQWNYYQAKSTKGHLMELAADIVGGGKQVHYREQVAKYEKQKIEIKTQAETLDAKSHQADKQSQALMRPLHRSEQSISLIQIAISLASITALTRKRWLFYVAGAAALGGLGLAGLAIL